MYNLKIFKKDYAKKINNIYHDIYARHMNIINVKKQDVAAANLKTIFESTLTISNKTGFHSMSLRDLSKESQISMGAMYLYIESKETLQFMILQQVLAFVKDILSNPPKNLCSGKSKLEWFIKTHIFLTDVVQPWFFFAYMEAKSFDRAGKRAAIESELLTESLIEGFIVEGVREGQFETKDAKMAASLIKPLLQDWYLKRWKYGRRKISADNYARSVLEFVDCILRPKGQRS